MNVWVVTPFEPIPTETDARPMRAGMLCSRLHGRGHRVTWWTPDFEHYTKTHRTQANTRIQVGDGYEIQLMKSLGYRSHVGMRRLLNNHLLGRRFTRLLEERTETPDVMVCAWPTPDLCIAASRYGRSNGIPVIIDIRDLWPDLWIGAFARPLTPAVRIAISPYTRMARESFRNSAVIVGLTNEYLEWALAKAGMARRPSDTVLGLGYERPESLSKDEQKTAEEGLARKGFTPDGRLTAVFAGNFGRTSDLETLVKTAAILDGRQDNPIRMVLCGSGDNWRNVKNASSGSRSITVLERLNRTELVTLLGRSEVGIAPFRDIENYQKNIPNKIYEYLAMKLALVSPVTGCIRRLIEEQGVGITYEPEDAESLARSLLNLAADRERLADCRNRAWTYFTGNMDAERIYDGYCDLIEGAGSRG